VGHAGRFLRVEVEVTWKAAAEKKHRDQPHNSFTSPDLRKPRKGTVSTRHARGVRQSHVDSYPNSSGFLIDLSGLSTVPEVHCRVFRPVVR
jgi:hypothetical protein